MAQIIRKFSGGGVNSTEEGAKTPTPEIKKKYGKFTHDGQEYEVDDNLLDQIGAYSQIVANSLRKGNNVYSYKDEDGVRIVSGIDSSGSNLNERQQQRFGRRQRILEGRKVRDARNEIDRLNSLVLNPTKKQEDDAPKLKYFDLNDDIYLDYITEGNNKRLGITRNNRLAEERLNLYLHPESLDKTKYNELRYGTYFRDADEANAFINQARSVLESNEFKQRYNSGTLTESDKAMLKSMGILTERPSRNSDNDNNSQEALARKYGFSNPEFVSKYVNFDQDGVAWVTDLFNQTFGTKNGIYNDWWEDYLIANNAWNPDFSFLNGYTRLGDRLYRTSDLDDPNSELYKFARREGGFYDLNTQNRFQDADNVLKYLWGRSDDFSEWDSNNLYSKWFNNQDPTFRYRPLTGTRNIPEGQQLIEYWTGNERDKFGRPLNYRYALLDNNGELVEDNINVNDYSIIPNGEQLGIKALSIINHPNSPYHGKYETNYSDKSGNNLYTLYIDPNNPDDIIMQNQEFSRRWNADNKNIRIPKILAQAINRNPNFWNTLLSDKNLQERFWRSLAEGYRTKTGEAISNIFGVSTLDLSDLTKLGFDADTAQIVYNYLENEYGDRNGVPLWKRRSAYLVNPYQKVETHQKGGVIGTTKDAAGTNSNNKVNEYKDPTKVAGARDEWNLSHADKLQIASIAGDVVSLVAAIPTGGNPLSAGLGVGSTLAQFGADISRDGFDLKDVGNLALGLGFDAISFLPGIGISGKSAKILKNIRKVADVIKPALIGIGAVQGATSLNNLLKGEGNINDWRNLANGLLALRSANQIRKNINATEYVGRKPSEVQIKTKDQLRNEYVDKIVKDKKLGIVNGKPAKWANDDGTIKDYNQAIKDLSESGDLKISKALETKWATEVAASKVSSKTRNIVSNEYNPFSSNFRWRMSNRRLPENFDLKVLKGNTSKLRTIGRLVRENPEIAEQLRSQNWILPKTFYNLKQNHGGNWFYRSPVFARMKGINTPSTQSLLPPPTGIRNIHVTLSGRKNPTIIENIDPYLQNVDEYIGMRFHKKGGIIKAEGGLDMDALNKDMEEVYNSGLKKLNISNNSGIGNSKSNLDWLSISKNATDLVRGVVPQIASNKATKAMKKRFWDWGQGNQKSHVAEIHRRFSDYGLNRASNNRINSMRGYQYNTSDPTLQKADRLAREQQVSQIEADRDLKYSQLQDEYNEKVLNDKRMYADARRQVADHNRAVIGEAKAQMAKADHDNIITKAYITTGMLDQLSAQLASDAKEKNLAEAAKKNVDAMHTYSQNAQKGYDTLKQIYDTEAAKYSGEDLEAWKKANDWNDVVTKYLNPVLAEGQNWVQQETATSMYNVGANQNPFIRRTPLSTKTWTPNWNFNIKFNPIQTSLGDSQQPEGTQSAKKGGKLSANERALLEAARDARRAVSKMNDNLTKLIISLMK